MDIKKPATTVKSAHGKIAFKQLSESCAVFWPKLMSFVKDELTFQSIEQELAKEASSIGPGFSERK